MILGHWADPGNFIEQLRHDPHKGTARHGIDLPREIEIVFIANDHRGFHLRRPPARDSYLGRQINKAMIDGKVFEALCGVMRCPLRSWSPVPLGDLADRYQALLELTRSDDQLLDRYVNDPWSVLAEYGVDIPRTVPLKVLVDRADLIYMVLPGPPPSARLKEFLSRFPADPVGSTRG